MEIPNNTAPRIGNMITKITAMRTLMFMLMIIEKISIKGVLTAIRILIW